MTSHAPLYFLLVMDFSASMLTSGIYGYVSKHTISALECVREKCNRQLYSGLMVFRGKGEVRMVKFESDSTFTKDLRQLNEALQYYANQTLNYSHGGEMGYECVAKAIACAATALLPAPNTRQSHKTAILVVSDALGIFEHSNEIQLVPDGLYGILRDGVQAQFPESINKWTTKCNNQIGDGKNPPAMQELKHDDNIAQKIRFFLTNNMGKSLEQLIIGGLRGGTYVKK